ncbi:hypothetical protein FHX42_005166 [Saccharopolyspora lacisalsi]|uniref:Uncharacterized protein n=1 Tax=Halosaccharopolyspora lacisalsi TaxID=1000566 RepID=A0A839E4I0_9PSEU|nr:hypothetical protein [Halosaccharopolyspora lacisalsi]
MTWTSAGTGARLQAILAEKAVLLRYEENGQPSRYGDVFYRLTECEQGREDFERRCTDQRQRDELEKLISQTRTRLLGMEQTLRGLEGAIQEMDVSAVSLEETEPLAEWEKDLLGEGSA